MRARRRQTVLVSWGKSDFENLVQQRSLVSLLNAFFESSVREQSLRTENWNDCGGHMAGSASR